MIVNTLKINATPKSRYDKQYAVSSLPKYSESVPAAVRTDADPVEKEEEQDVIFVNELPATGYSGILYVDLQQKSCFFWAENEEEEEAGEFIETANIRVWSGLFSDFPEEESGDARPGWLYIAEDLSLVFIWKGGEYVNISGVTEIEAELPLEVEYEEEDIKALAKISIKKATLSDVGVVKPDGKTTSVNADGVLTAQYAVGDIFTTTRAGNPSALLGYGTWTQLSGVLYGASSGAGTSTGDGKIKRSDLPNVTLAGSGTAQSAGAHTHSTSGTAASAGAHTHSYTYPSGSAYAGDSGSAVRSTGSASTGSAGAHTHSTSGTAASAGAHTHSVSITTDSMNGGVTQSEYIPKGVYVYHWLRTA